jgi:hypothetical protein
VDKKDFNQDTTTFVEANSLIRNAKKKMVVEFIHWG